MSEARLEPPKCYICDRRSEKWTIVSGAPVCERCVHSHILPSEYAPVIKPRTDAEKLAAFAASAVVKSDDGLREASDGTVLHYGKWLATRDNWAEGSCMFCGVGRRDERLAHLTCWDRATEAARKLAKNLADGTETIT